MNKKLQVFVSSTYTDLIEERQAAVQAILDAGHIPAGMELFKAGKSQIKTIQKWIDNSDVYMLILGGRYGSIEEESGLSYTELEYRYALSRNIPVFAIVLDDNFLFTKAASKGKDIIFEKDNIDKYDTFKNIVKSNIIKFVKNIDQIPSAIHAQLNDVINDKEYNLIGWIRSDQDNAILNDFTQCDLNKHIEELFKNYVFKYTSKNLSSFTNAISPEIIKILQFKALLDSSQRTIELEILRNSNLVKVTTTQIMNFSYISSNEPYFKLYAETTKQQCDTFKVENLTIDSIDYTHQIKLSYTIEPFRGQFIYIIRSDFVPPNLETCNVFYKCSYECPTLDFFQTYRLLYPCNIFSVTIILKNDVDSLYSILGSTYSPFSKVYYDNFKAFEIHNNGICSMKLPNWSLPGTGYVVTLKNKSKENHI